ncbi:hypothetical protein COO60DRAFT_1629238 [Scenedesmus sp. NREL 46B-D3]|nr:hypothetical protein COO60DRAFT_1629238 [Scenedesmus sp. NREL 46B-D3]
MPYCHVCTLYLPIGPLLRWSCQQSGHGGRLVMGWRECVCASTSDFNGCGAAAACTHVNACFAAQEQVLGLQQASLCLYICPTSSAVGDELQLQEALFVSALQSMPGTAVCGKSEWVTVVPLSWMLLANGTAYLCVVLQWDDPKQLRVSCCGVNPRSSSVKQCCRRFKWPLQHPVISLCMQAQCMWSQQYVSVLCGCCCACQACSIKPRSSSVKQYCRWVERPLRESSHVLVQSPS